MPPLHSEPPQQGSPASPQCRHALVRHTLVVSHVVPPQQRVPVVPHGTHVRVASQVVPAAVHMDPGQQGSPAPPQPLQ